MLGSKHNSGLRDNHTRGTVAEFLRAQVQTGSKLSIVSAYFTIYAYEALKAELEGIEHLNFLFGEPSFVNRLDPDKSEKKAFLIEADGLQLSNRLQQKRIARECAEWIKNKVHIKTVKQSNLLHGKMYHIDNGGVEEAILGSSNFTVRGLGLGTAGNNIELNLIEDVIQSGVKTKVLLLSATPVNNGIADLRNQISLIAGGDVARDPDPAFDAAFHETLGVPSVKETTRQAQQKFTLWTKKPPAQRHARDLIHELGSDFFKLLDGLSLSLYHPSSFLKDDLPAAVREAYAVKIGNFNQEGRERILIAMMKVNFLKRLESSIESIKSTFARRSSASLLSGRGGLLPTARETPSAPDDLELITWLVIMEKGL